MSSTSPELAGQVALVTGAAQGIGQAVARALAARGAHVAAVDRNAPALSATCDRAVEVGEIWAHPVDVTDSEAVDAAVSHVEQRHGPVSVLVNAAGVLRPSPAARTTDDDWAYTFAVNTSGVLHTCRAVAPRMAARGGGSIVTIGSNAAGVPRTNMAAYAASKAAAVMFTRCLGLELAPSGVRCNIVSPGSTDTPMQRALWSDPHAARRVVDGDPATFRVGIPLGRVADPDDIAEAVAFLVSDRARHITMHDLYVDGGATLRA